jgi:hypothetical protein
MFAVDWIEGDSQRRANMIQDSGWSGCDRANLPGRCRAFRRERATQALKAKDIRLAERIVQVGSVDAAGFLRLMEDDEG